MTLAARLSNLGVGERGLPCPVAAILPKLSDTDRAALIEVMDVPANTPGRISNTRLARALNDEGYPIHFKGVERHRTKACRCYSSQ